ATVGDIHALAVAAGDGGVRKAGDGHGGLDDAAARIQEADGVVDVIGDVQRAAVRADAESDRPRTVADRGLRQPRPGAEVAGRRELRVRTNADGVDDVAAAAGGEGALAVWAMGQSNEYAGRTGRGEVLDLLDN